MKEFLKIILDYCKKVIKCKENEKRLWKFKSQSFYLPKSKCLKKNFFLEKDKISDFKRNKVYFRFYFVTHFGLYIAKYIFWIVSV